MKHGAEGKEQNPVICNPVICNPVICDRVTLSVRRQDINLKFAQKALKSEKYKTWFCKFNPTEQVSKTRSVNDNLYVPVEARTKAFDKSPLAYLTRLLNGDN